MPTTILTHASPGCPNNLGTTAGDLYEILKWALPQLGWTLEYDDSAAQKAVFRNDPAFTGHGAYMRVLDDGSSGAGGSRAEIRCYANMTDIDTGTGELQFCGIQKDYDGAGSGEFEIWGNGDYFCLLNVTDALTSGRFPKMLTVIGNIVGRDPTDNLFVQLTSADTLSSSIAANNPWYAAATPYPANPSNVRDFCRRALTSYDGATPNLTIAPYVVSVFNQYGTSSELHIGGAGGTGSNDTRSPIDPITGNLSAELGYICDDETLRGRLPGILFPIGNWVEDITYNDGDIITITNSLGTHDYELIYLTDAQRSASDTNMCAVLIEQNRESV